MLLSNIQIVLVGTSHPGNIGAVARAMKNMCLSELLLVKPVLYPHAQATARASGADDVLAAGRQFDTLAEAIHDCRTVFGVSARQRTVSWPTISARDSAKLANKLSHQHKIAFVFGCEHSGLTNDELDLCQYLVKIPSNPDFPSLNLGAAAQIILYELLMEERKGKSLDIQEERDLVSIEDMERFYQHMEEVLVSVEFLRRDQPGLIMRRLRRLFGRSRLDRREMNILRGILTSISAKTSG